MLELKNITKIYNSGAGAQKALDNVSVSFAGHEFVSILGASGSGKTTLLNLIGGLDVYDEGDMIVDGMSTKSFKDKDWDSYRNSTIGFVFQSYNLISHLSVLENVKLAMSISGISNRESKEKATEVLKKVGLSEHMNKRPNQLSGGQMQRVAIARALVTDPKIILADEPTGALDSSTSAQIMDLIKEISKDKLVIMVTHNPEIAQKYSDRIIRLSDGVIIEDTVPNTKNDDSEYNSPRTSMSFVQAINSSFKNLLTKKVRTVLTTIAASIGIISIATVMAISSGMNSYIKSTQEDTISTMPVAISAVDYKKVLRTSPSKTKPSKEIKLADAGSIHLNRYTENALGGNDGDFISYMKKHAGKYYKSLEYSTGYMLKALIKDENGKIQPVKENEVRTIFNTISNFAVLPADEKTITNDYDILASKTGKFKYPGENEAILFVSAEGTLNENQLALLGYSGRKSVKPEEIIGKKFKILNNNQYFRQFGDVFVPNEITESLYDEGKELEIIAVMRLNDSSKNSFNGLIGYNRDFLDSMLKMEKDSDIVKAQQESRSKNLIGGSGDSLTDEGYQEIMQQLGGDSTPKSISFYAKTFDDREAVISTLTKFNKEVEKKYGKDTDNYQRYAISYTDTAKLITKAFGDIINSITFILIAFSAISLLVSSVMIGILIYVSVVERTKEIGILRALGSRKKDVSRIFNAEAAILGFTSGVLGVAVASALTVPINKLVAKSLDISGFNASVSVSTAVSLIVLSVVLTLIAGFIPSRIAAKKNPVEALRTE